MDRTAGSTSLKRPANGAPNLSLDFRYLFGYSTGRVSRSPAMTVPDLKNKLDILMSLAVDDRDGRPPPPRLRHAAISGPDRGGGPSFSAS